MVERPALIKCLVPFLPLNPSASRPLVSSSPCSLVPSSPLLSPPLLSSPLLSSPLLFPPLLPSSLLSSLLFSSPLPSSLLLFSSPLLLFSSLFPSLLFFSTFLSPFFSSLSLFIPSFFSSLFLFPLPEHSLFHPEQPPPRYTLICISRCRCHHYLHRFIREPRLKQQHVLSLPSASPVWNRPSAVEGYTPQTISTPTPLHLRAPAPAATPSTCLPVTAVTAVTPSRATRPRWCLPSALSLLQAALLAYHLHRYTCERRL
jgi:hypothetical protein